MPKLGFFVLVPSMSPASIVISEVIESTLELFFSDQPPALMSPGAAG
jgi:hypothetical protein